MFNSITERNEDIVQLEHFTMYLFKTYSDHTGQKVWKWYSACILTLALSKCNYSSIIKACTKPTMSENIALGSVWVAGILAEKSIQNQ